MYNMSEMFLWSQYRNEGEIIITRFSGPKEAIMKKLGGGGEDFFLNRE
jgi:hypothetical protein